MQAIMQRSVAVYAHNVHKIYCKLYIVKINIDQASSTQNNSYKKPMIWV